jgi:hypothetical protein
MIALTPIAQRLYKTIMSIPSYFETDPGIALPPVKVHDVEAQPEKRPRTLKHLLKANHINYSLMYNHFLFDNHMPHLLCSAYALGATDQQLHHIYDELSATLEQWTDPPANISENDWKLYLGDPEYQRGYVDFFEDELALKHEYEWKVVADEFLYGGDHPFIDALICGLGHPMIHLAYAFEFASKEVGMEALALTAVEYDFLHKYSADPSYVQPGDWQTQDPLEIFKRIYEDKRLDGYVKIKGVERPGGSNTTKALFDNHEALLLEYWNAFDVTTDPLKAFELSQQAAVQMLVSSVPDGVSPKEYDFFICHVLTTSHALRVLLPHIRKKYHVRLLRQWFLLAIIVYILQDRPKINTSLVSSRPLADGPRGEDKDWRYLDHLAITNAFSTDAHYVKAMRAIREAAATWGDDEKMFLKAGVRLAEDFEGWFGFPPPPPDTLDPRSI